MRAGERWKNSTVEDGETLLEGRLYKGEERIEELQEQTDWEF